MSKSEDAVNSDLEDTALSASEKRALRAAKRSRSGYTLNIDRETKVGLDLISLQEPDRKLLTVCVKKLRNYISRVEDLNVEILGLTSDPSEAEDEVRHSSEALNEFWESVYTFETHLEHMHVPPLNAAHAIQLGSAPGVSGQLHNASGTTHNSHSNSIKLPKLAMQKYSGDTLEFQEFWDFFEGAIHENPDLSDVEKFSYLKGHLRGKALSHVAGYRLTAANYPHVIATFKERFGNSYMAQIAHFEALLSIPMASADTEQLRSMFDTCEMHIRSLVALGLSENTFEVVFCPILLSKLPWQIRTQLVRKNGSKPCTLQDLRKLLKEELEVREMCQAVVHTRKDESAYANKGAKGQGGYRNPKGTAATLVTSNQRSAAGAQQVHSCVFCNQQHAEENCRKFRDSQSRRQQLSNGTCYSCLESGHHSRFCRKKKQCAYCKRNGHHQSLCNQQFPEPSHASSSIQSAVAQPSGLNAAAPQFVPLNETNTSMIASGQRAVLQTAVADVQPIEGSTKVKARFLLDTGSSRTYITKAVSDKLRLVSTSVDVIAVAGFGDKQRRSQQYPVVQFDIVARDGRPIRITANVTPHITCPIERFPLNHQALPILVKMDLADTIPQKTEMFGVDVLIGCDHYHDIVLGGRMEVGNGLILLESRLGAVISGRTNAPGNQDAHNVMLISGSKQSGTHDLERFWRLEDIGVKEKSDKKDEDVLEQFQQSIRVVDGRYTVRWPYNSNVDELPDNYHLALGRLKSLMRRLTQDKELLGKYSKILDDQWASGVIEVAPIAPDGREHYMPHHAVVTPSKATTKVRIVYDGSAKTRVSSVSLNECLYRGPVLLSDLVGLVIRFRTYQFGVVSDIEKAFLQIGLDKNDRDTTRFLWLKDPSKPVSEKNLLVFRFTRIPFGLKPCTFFLEAVMSHHLKTIGTPVARQIDDDHYADNVATGLDSPLDCVQFYDEAKELFAKASMNLREWITNCPQLSGHIPDCDKAEGVEAKVLGVVWNTEKDSLRCARVHIADASAVTKRQCLKAIASLFDPCGFISPFSVKGKMLMQSLWKSGCGWDEPIAESYEQAWREFESELRSVHLVELPRKTLMAKPVECDVQLHCFCDASGAAYGGAVYLRSTKDQEIAVHLVFSKTRVSPIKPSRTIPNLELMAAVVGCRIVKFVQAESKLNFSKVVVWSDSQCTLCWINQDRVKTPFVRNRVAEIQASGISEFRYVKSEDNPADLLSRGATIERLIGSELWWKGPQWLSEPESEWPEWEAQVSSKGIEEIDPVVYEADVMLSYAEQSKNAELPCDPERFSSLQKLLRVTCWVVRFAKACRKRPVKGTLSADEIAHAKFIWQLQVQKEAFPETVLKDLSLSKLNLYRDESGLIRCKGRLEMADIPEMSKNPKLLPRNHSFTDLVIRHVHVEMGHAAVEHTLSQLRYEFWVPKGRSQVKRVIGQCNKCRRVTGGPFRSPPMPVLPDFRVSQVAPFTYVGLDYLGPSTILDFAKNKVKAWLCLFTCASVRALHLEVVETMSAAGFLLALRRLIAIRGCPRMLVSDNAAQFHSVDRVLRKMWVSIRNDPTVSSYVAKQCITWKFIPEFAPWMGGFYERLVGVTKMALKKSMDSRCLEFVEFQTIVAEVARMVNSRPLVYVGEEVGDIHLTPSHFLNGSGSVLPVDRPKENADPDFVPQGVKPDLLILQWRRGQAALDAFWKMWVGRYLLSLRSSHRRISQRGGSAVLPEVGTVVLVKRANMPRGSWQMARVIKKNVSKDGLCRSVAVKNADGKVIVRPLRFLFPLEATDAEAQGEPSDSETPLAKVPRKTRAAAVRSRERTQQLLRGGSDSE